jgi:hypothetical protein
MKRWLHWIVLLTLLLALEEILFRAVFPIPEVANFNRVNYTTVSVQEFGPSFLSNRAPAMNAAFQWKSRPDGASFELHLNLYGFRDRTWRVQPQRGTDRVMFVGDSIVEGFMASDRETIPHGYANAAAQSREAVEAMNFGLGAMGIDHYLRLVRDAAPLFRPNRIIVVMYANDLPYSSTVPDNVGPVLTPVYTWPWLPRGPLVAWRALRREVVPRRWHSRATLFVPVVPHPLNPWSKPPPQFSRIDAGLADAMRKGELNPFLVDFVNNADTALRQPTDPSNALRRFQAMAQSVSAELRIVYLPFSVQVSDYYLPFLEKYALHPVGHSLTGPECQIHAAAIAKSCHDLGIPFLDLTPLLKEAEATQEHLYWNYDDHMRGSSYLRVGATIYEWVNSGDDQVKSLHSLN